MTQIYKKTYTNIKHKIFKELVLSVFPLMKKKKHVRLGHTGMVDNSVNLSITDFLNVQL